MKNDLDLHYKSATALMAALSNKEISSVELLELAISRINLFDKKINAIVAKDFEQAHLASQAADKAISRGVRLPLLGLPITVKESFNVVGLPTTWGNIQYKNWHPKEDALVISRLKAAGAIIIGKTNVPYMLADWQSYNEIYGTTNNPWNVNLTPGGSSGGSAAALAAGFTPLELGSDMAGSLRVPASFCGVFAHKPTLDLVPMRGAGPPSSILSPHRIDLVVAGPMARTSTDLLLALDILSGPDEMQEGKGYKLSLPMSRHNKLDEFRILILDTHPLCPTATRIHKSMDNLADHLTKLGVRISRGAKNIPDLAKITKNFIFILNAHFSADLPIELYDQSLTRVNKLGSTDMSIAAFRLRGAVSTHREWLLAMRTRTELRQEWRNLFKEFDVVICPVMPTLPYPHDHSEREKRKIQIDDMFVPYGDQFSWVSIASLFGLPATTLPIDHTENNLPIGIQVIGDYLEDYTTIKFANLLEQELGAFAMPQL